jgi:hypothetical protein
MKVRTPAAWGPDRDPRPMTPQNPRNVREMFLHYPADPNALKARTNTQRERDAYMRGIRDFHMDGRGWSYFAYSFAVFQDGSVYKGRGIDNVPAGQEGHNTNTFAVLCVVGNDEAPSAAMKESLRELKNFLDGQAGRDLNARPHSAVVATACPGPKIRAIIPELNRKA